MKEETKQRLRKNLENIKAYYGERWKEVYEELKNDLLSKTGGIMFNAFLAAIEAKSKNEDGAANLILAVAWEYLESKK